MLMLNDDHFYFVNLTRMPRIHRCQHLRQHAHRGSFGHDITIKMIMSIIR